MNLDTVIALRVPKHLKVQLMAIALESGVSASSLARNTLSLCLISKTKSKTDDFLQKIIKEAKREGSEDLWIINREDKSDEQKGRN